MSLPRPRKLACSPLKITSTDMYKFEKEEMKKKVQKILDMIGEVIIFHSP